MRASALSTNRAPRLSSSNRLSLSSSSKVTSKVQHHHTSQVVILEWYGNGRVQIGFSGESKPRFSSFHFRPDSNDETSKEDVSSFLSRIYSSHLLLSGKSRSVVVLETDVTCRQKERKELTMAFLRDLKVPKVLFIPTLCTAPYTLGIRHVACVVQILEREAQITIWWRGKVLIPQILILVPLTKEDIVAGIETCLDEKCPIDLRSEASNNVLLIGKLPQDIHLDTKNRKWKLRLTPFAPQFISWIGASILCQTQDLSQEKWLALHQQTKNDNSKQNVVPEPYDYLSSP